VYTGAAAVVLPSLTEGIPLTLLESLSVGTPVVATAVGGIPELAGTPGLTLTPRDSRDAFVAAVVELIERDARTPGQLPAHMRVEAMCAAYEEIVDQAGGLKNESR
jgi:glycosyltransferase involved in cell wall biosynthesis